MKKMTDENKMELIAGLDTLVELCDAISDLDAKAISQDHADDRPRNLAVRALDGLIQKHFGEMTQPQDAQVRLAIHRLRENEKQDFDNDRAKQKARELAGEVKERARRLRDLLVATAFMLLLCVNANASVNIDALAQKIIQAESSGRASAVGDGGKARGLMQIQEATWKRHTPRPFSDAFDPALNKAVGMAELKRIVLAYRAKGVEPSEAYVVWAYNTGSLIKRSLPKFDKNGNFHKWTWNHPNAIYRAIYREYLS